MLQQGRLHFASYIVIAGLLLFPRISPCTQEFCPEVKVKPLHCVTGTVINIVGEPVGKATVTIRSDGMADVALTTGEDGKFSFYQLKAGRYELEIQADGYLTFQFPIFIRKPSSQAKRALEIRLTTGYPQYCTYVRLVKH